MRRYDLRPDGSDSEALAETLLGHQPAEPAVTSLMAEYRFAGATAVNCYLLQNQVPPNWSTKEAFKANLVAMYGQAVLDRGLRPQITIDPQLVAATDSDNRLVLTYVFQRGERRIWQDFRVRKIPNQVVEYVVIHFHPFMVEVRAPFDKARLFKDVLLNLVGIDPQEAFWEPLTQLSDIEVRELARRLGAKLAVARHKMDSGPYDYSEVGAAPDVDDLEQVAEYQQAFGNLPMRKKVLLFEHTYASGIADTVKYEVTGSGRVDQHGRPDLGGLWFRSSVGEEVILRVIQEIQQIRSGT